jgi:hypothetical protein
MVICRAAGTTPDPFGSRTRMSLNSGRNLEIGSVSLKRPSSANIRTATLVTGLVIEAMRKIVLSAVGRPFPASADPTAAEKTGLPR